MEHQEIDQRSFDLHQLIADKLKADPALLNKALKNLDHWEKTASKSSEPYIHRWRSIVEQGLDAVLQQLADRSENGDTMRQTSPFAGVLSNQERWQFFRLWRQRDQRTA